MTPPQHLVALARSLAAHEGVTHWAISGRMTRATSPTRKGKGDFFLKLMDGGDCRTSTYTRTIRWFAANWPQDLEWPSDIPRPTEEDAA